VATARLAVRAAAQQDTVVLLELPMVLELLDKDLQALLTITLL
jgi:hypothetical protein